VSGLLLVFSLLLWCHTLGASVERIESRGASRALPSLAGVCHFPLPLAKAEVLPSHHMWAGQQTDLATRKGHTAGMAAVQQQGQEHREHQASQQLDASLRIVCTAVFKRLLECEQAAGSKGGSSTSSSSSSSSLSSETVPASKVILAVPEALRELQWLCSQQSVAGMPCSLSAKEAVLPRLPSGVYARVVQPGMHA